MTREQFEEALQPALFRTLRRYAVRIVGERLADDAVQEALGTFRYEKFDPAGSAAISTFLIWRVEQRALNLLAKERRLQISSFQDSEDTGVLSYELWGELSPDAEESTLEGDFWPIVHRLTDDEAINEFAEEGNTAESDEEEIDQTELRDELLDPEIPVDLILRIDMLPEIQAASLDMVQEGVERSRYHDAHPWARREYLKDKRPFTPEEREELEHLDEKEVYRVIGDLVLQHMQDLKETETNTAWYRGYSSELHTKIASHLKQSYPGPLTRHPHGKKVQLPGVNNDFCDRLHHHKYGYLPLRLLSCHACLPNDEIRPQVGLQGLTFSHIPRDPPLGFPDTQSLPQAASRLVLIWPTELESLKSSCRQLDYSYEETQVRRFHPSLADDCPIVWDLIRHFLYGFDGLRLHGIAGRTRQPTKRSTQSRPFNMSMGTPWIGGDPLAHALYARYFELLNEGQQALLWLTDQNFDQEYTQEEIVAGCDLSESTGLTADRVNDPYAQDLAKYFTGVNRSTISRRYRTIQKKFHQFQTNPRVFPTWRSRQSTPESIVPADTICLYCGGLLLDAWVDPLRVLLLPTALEGTDAAYHAKHCINCGDYIDNLTLRRRGATYDKRADASLRDTYTLKELEKLIKHCGTLPLSVIRELSRRHTVGRLQDLTLPPRHGGEGRNS